MHLEAPVEIKTDTLKNSPNEPEMTTLQAAFTSSLVAVVATVSGTGRPHRRKRTYVSRQSPNSRRRQRTSQGPGRVQAGDRREIRHAILHHKFGREGCPDISLRGMGADRAEAGQPLHFQSDQEEVPVPRELLGAASGNGWPGSLADPAVAARERGHQGRSRRAGKLDLPGSAQPGSVADGDRDRVIHHGR